MSRTVVSTAPTCAEVEQVPAALTQSLRSDARDNRERLLAAARAAFAAAGPATSMREIARRAGVSPATLYRRFPTKEDVVAEVVTVQMAACTAIVEEGLAAADPWSGFCHVIEQICVVHAADHGLTEALLTTYPRTADVAGARAHAVQALGAIIGRAQGSGSLRGDFRVQDVALILRANGGVRVQSPVAAAAAARRLASLMINGVRS